MQVNPADSSHATLTGRPSSPHLAVDLRRFPWMASLALDYAHRFDRVAPFYAGNPAEPSAWRDAIARVQAHPRRRDELAALLSAQQHRRAAPEPARAAARLLANPQTVAIVTGQQAGLFGGPLYTLLKALTAIKLADEVSRTQHVKAVAVFWVDAEDHDWDEVRGCTVLDQAWAPHTVQLPARGGEGSTVATIALDAAIEEAAASLEGALGATEFRTDLMAALRRAYRPGAGMAEAFACWIEHALGERGLIVYDSSDPAAKPLASAIFARELSAPGQTSALALEAGTQLAARGYHAQVQPQPDNLALFHLDGARRLIRRGPGGLTVGDTTADQAALVEEAASHPSHFSPNVLLRPVVEDAMFPTICYVAGPSELAYFGQLRGVYAHFGVPMPLVYPRASATLVDSAALRFLTKYDVGLESLQPQDEAALNALLQAQMPPVIEQTFGEAAGAVEAQMTRLAGVLPLLDPTLEGAAKSTLGKMQHDLQTLHGKMIQAAKRRDETLRRQYLRTRALAFPEGHAQERAIGFVSFLNQYGLALVDRLADELPLDMGYHWVLAI